MRILHIVCLLGLFSMQAPLFAQSGCPNCVLNLPTTLSADTVYLPPLPPGTKGKPYNQDISFRLPKTTTPVNKIDGVTPPGLPISKIEIVSVDNLPPGLRWQASQLVYEPAKATDGCIKLCGTPLLADSFKLLIRLKATVLVLNQETSFTTRLYIAPEVRTNAAFSMENPTGCNTTTVRFSNGIPSGGKTGFTYQWSFGDGTTSTAENPPAKTYTQAGKYTVRYQARIDTARTVLQTIRVLGADCSDLLNGPDLYLTIKDPAKKVIFKSSPVVENTPLPFTFLIGQPIGTGNYTLEVFDDDSGLGFADDVCGSLTFNNASRDTLVAGKLRVVFTTFQPITTVTATDTVRVFAPPAKPQISVPTGLSVCTGDTVRLVSTYPMGHQWLRNSQPIPNANQAQWRTTQAGFYKVRYTDTNGCSALSDSVQVKLVTLPSVPLFENRQNLLALLNPDGLPRVHRLQWLLEGQPIAGATGSTYCAEKSGNYTVQVTDVGTGCRNAFQLAVTVNPNTPCSTGTSEPTVATLRVFPNPTQGQFEVELPADMGPSSTLRIWDATGRLYVQQPLPTNGTTLTMTSEHWPAGLYWLQISGPEGLYLAKMVRNP